MLSKLNKLASKFSLFLSKKSDVLKDPLLKLTPHSQRIEPEMTEDLDGLVKDSLNLVILLERSLMEFQKDSMETKNELGLKFTSNVLIDLEDIEDALTNPELLNFDLNTETSYLDVVDQNISLLKSVLDLTKDGGKIAPEFKNLDQRVYRWVNELIENSDKLHDKAMGQSTFMEHHFADRPIRMLEQDPRDIDQINPDEIHVDYDDGPDHFSEEALNNEIDVENELNKKFPDKEFSQFESGLYQDLVREKERREWASGKRHK